MTALPAPVWCNCPSRRKRSRPPPDGGIDASAGATAKHGAHPAHIQAWISARAAGGISMGRALTARPDCYAAVVSGLVWHDPLRYLAQQNGMQAQAAGK